MDFKIEKNIPAPKKGRPPRYPFREMAIGDSFSFPAGDVGKVRSAATWNGKRSEMKFTVRICDGAGRIWRIA